MNKKMLKTAISSAAGLPLFAFAQEPSIYGLLAKVDNIMRRIISILFTAGTVVFLWGVIEYMTAAGDEKKIKDARKKITYGIIGLFLMVAVWGIVRAIVVTFGLDASVDVQLIF